MTLSLPKPLALLAVLAAAACNCGDTGLKTIKDGAIEILSPADGETVASIITFTARATSTEGLQWASLKAGSLEVATCTPGADPQVIECTQELEVPKLVAEAQNNALVLTALARTNADDLVEKSVTVVLAPLTVSFRKPVLSQQDPPMARVAGRSDVELFVDSLQPVEAVIVTADDQSTPIAQWRGQPDTRQYKQPLDWAKALTTGEHVLKAAARDVNGAVARAELRVVVMCGADSECPTNQRCCPSSGKCNPIVAPGADCDCDHPCPYDQGCFPGTCGLLPRKCRPGCDPGGNSRGDNAEKCYSPEMAGGQAVPAYCARLPAGEATGANEGGACAPGSACDVAAQNCPRAPLDRNQPVSPTNPLIDYTCTPVGPNDPNNRGKDVATCFPAGGLPDGTTNCDDSCNDVSRSCAKGLLCVTLIGPDDQPLGPPTCRKQCTKISDPLGGLFGGGGGGECPSGQLCGGLLGPGFERYNTGACSPL
jgi:hypothetical protein